MIHTRFQNEVMLSKLTFILWQFYSVFYTLNFKADETFKSNVWQILRSHFYIYHISFHLDCYTCVK